MRQKLTKELHKYSVVTELKLELISNLVAETEKLAPSMSEPKKLSLLFPKIEIETSSPRNFSPPC